MILHRKQFVFIAIIIICLGIILIPLLAEKNFFSGYIQLVVAKLPIKPKPPVIKPETIISPIQISNTPVTASVNAWCIKVYPNNQQNFVKVLEYLQQHGFAAFMQQDEKQQYQILIGPELAQDKAQSISIAVNKELGFKTDVIRYDYLKID